MKQYFEPTQLAAGVTAALGVSAPPHRTVGVKELSSILSLSQQAIRLYMCTPSLRHLAPPNAFKLPGHSAWRWWLDEVLEWMSSGEKEKQRRPRGKPKGSTTRALQARREAERAAAAGGGR